MPALSSSEPSQFDQPVFEQDESQGFNFPEPSSEDEEGGEESESAEAPKKGSGGKAPASRAAGGKPGAGGKTPRKALAPKAKADSSSKKTQAPTEPTPGKKRKNAPTPSGERDPKKPTSRDAPSDAKHERVDKESVEDKPTPSNEKKIQTIRKTRSPTARPHRRLAQEVVDFRVEKIESRVARLSKQIEVAVKHLKAYKKEIEYRRLEQEEEESSDEAKG